MYLMRKQFERYNLLPSWTLVLTLLYIIPFLSYSAGFDVVSETVSFHGLNIAEMVIKAKISDDYLHDFTTGKRSFENICAVVEATGYMYNCRADISKIDSRLTITAVIRLDLIMAVSGVTARDNQLFIEFYFQYRPVVYLLGEEPQIYRFKIEFPDGRVFKSENPGAVLMQKFTIYGYPLPIDFEQSSEYAGDIIKLKITDAEQYAYCVAELLDENNVVYSYIASSMCDRIALSTPAAIEKKDFFVAIYAIDKNLRIHATIKDISLKYPPIVINTVFLDEEDKYSVLVEGDFPCELFLYDSSDKIVWSQTLDKCDGKHLISFKAGLPADIYHFIVQSTASDGEIPSKSSFVFQMPAISSFVSIDTDKDIYYIGEQIYIRVEPENYVEECSVYLTDISGRQIWPDVKPIRQECENIYISTDNIHEGGIYIVNLDAYSSGVQISHEKKIITVKNLDFKYGSDINICKNGLFYLKEESSVLPCIAQHEICKPRAMRLSGCLCFSRIGELIDVCKFGEECGESGCIKKRDIVNRVIIAPNGLEYLLHPGGISPFVKAAELCAGICACVDNNYNIRDWCEVGEICMPGSQCCVPELKVDIRKIEPENLRADELEQGTNFRIYFTVRRGDDILKDFFTAYIYAAGEKFEAELYNYKGIWVAEAHLKTNLKPGQYVFIFEIVVDSKGRKEDRCSDTTFARRIPVKVLYSRDEKIDVKILNILPEQISKKQIENGVNIVITAYISDTEIDIDNLKLFMGKEEIKLYKIVKSGKQYVINGYINATFYTDRVNIKLIVNRLGREGYDEITYIIPDRLTVSVQILSVDPEIIFEQFLSGFEIAMVIGVQADDISLIKQSDFTLYIEGDFPEIYRKIKPDGFLAAQEGFILRFWNVNYCKNLPELNIERKTSIKLYVTLNYDGKEYSSDKIELPVIPCVTDIRDENHFCGIEIDDIYLGCLPDY